jgi:hypothetical protein
MIFEIIVSTSLIIITLIETANLFLIDSAFNVINEFIKGDERDIHKKDHSEEYLSMFN